MNDPRFGLLLESLDPKCPFYKWEFGSFGICGKKPENEDDPSKQLTQCDGRIKDCSLPGANL